MPLMEPVVRVDQVVRPCGCLEQTDNETVRLDGQDLRTPVVTVRFCKQHCGAPPRTHGIRFPAIDDAPRLIDSGRLIVDL